ncbi:MAG: hypothetical protein M0O99_05645, partial [Desulfuromonas thiophila]|nr:hypothetical protein [Desulfuromonas thiophila]
MRSHRHHVFPKEVADVVVVAQAPDLLLCAALLLTGCVSKTRYDQQVSSAEQLRLQLDRCEEDRSQIKTSLADAQASLEQAL